MKARRRWAGALLLLLAAGCERDGRTPAERAVDPALVALIDSILPRIGELAGLEPRGPVTLERRSSDDVRAFVESRLASELPEPELQGMRRSFVLLGLLPDTLDLRRLLLDLYTEQVVGYYDPATKRLYIVDGVPRDALRPVLVHELVHALQDQHANIDSLVSRRRGNDRQTAAHAALEGHAMLVMTARLAEEAAGTPVSPELLPNPADEIEIAIEAQDAAFPVFRSAPAIIRRSLLFPYVAGAGFVRDLWLHRPRDTRREAPLGPLLPQSTEQVLSPVDRFIVRRDEPVELRFEAQPAGWRVAYESTLGAFETLVLLQEHLGAAALAVPLGWGGDRYRLLEADDGALALVMASVWDDAAAADRYQRAIGQVAERLGRAADFAAERTEIDGRPAVRVVLTDGVAPAAVPALVARVSAAEAWAADAADTVTIGARP